ncbi:unnamed protein product [Urochloa decumbens]|uniref:Glycosyltransferase n=1 Tax=Urochloa decumbens TaxID=240449 RepID=A0ABC9H9E4_9POAL
MVDKEEVRPQHNSHHFLLVAYGVQSHINPGRVLAHRLTRLGIDGSVLATLSIPVASYHRMFPDATMAETATDGIISYIPCSDGVDDGSWPKDANDRALRRRASSENLSAIVARFADRGQPVTCIICTMIFLPVLDVAREHNIPVAIYWIQPATLLAINYHYFHGYNELITSHATDPTYKVCLPGLSCPLQIVGPMVGSSTEARIHLFKHDNVDKKRYMEWLQAHPEKSVVYVSFGSVTKNSKRQMDEIIGGLRQCRRPYLLVVRKDGLEDDDENNHNLEDTQSQLGMVVEWCDQLEVLSHSAVGCFVSHCGWNSTIEAVVSGVPVIGVPNMLDQLTNIYLIEEEWGIGIKGERNNDGVVTGTELARCIELVMGESPKAMAIRERSKALKEIAQASVNAGGSAEKKLRDFIKTIQVNDTFCMDGIMSVNKAIAEN